MNDTRCVHSIILHLVIVLGHYVGLLYILRRRERVEMGRGEVGRGLERRGGRRLERLVLEGERVFLRGRLVEVVWWLIRNIIGLVGDDWVSYLDIFFSYSYLLQVLIVLVHQLLLQRVAVVINALNIGLHREILLVHWVKLAHIHVELLQIIVFRTYLLSLLLKLYIFQLSGDHLGYEGGRDPIELGLREGRSVGLVH